MGKSWKDNEWHEPDEMWEEEQRKRRRGKRVINENVDEQTPAWETE